MANDSKRNERDEVLTEVFEKMAGGKPHGGQAALAKALTERKRAVSKQAIGQWKRVPDAYVRIVSELTGLPMHRLRPDLYGFLSRSGRAEATAA